MRDNRRGQWALFGALLVVGSYAHNYALLWLFAALCLFPWLEGHRQRGLGWSVGVAALAYAPWTVALLRQAASGAHDWLRPFWETTPPALALVRTIEVFAPGAAYPIILRPLPQHSTLRYLALGFMLLLLCVALAPRGRQAERSDPEPNSLPLILVSAFAFAPLGMAWLISTAAKPIYLVGRYDLVALAPFALLVSVGAARLPRPFRIAYVLLLLTLSAVSLRHYYPNLTYDSSRRAAAWLAQHAGRQDQIVYLELRRAGIEYYLGRLGAPRLQSCSFPASTDGHKGGYSSRELERDMVAVIEEARGVRERRTREVDPEAHVWLAVASRNRVNPACLDSLDRQFEVDDAGSAPGLGILCLRAR